MRSTIIEIDSKKLRNNINLLKKTAPNSEILAVVKANAYGHGAVQITKILSEEDISYVGVAYAEEGQELRNSGYDRNIVILVPASEDEIDLILGNNLEFSTCNMSLLKQINAKAAESSKIVKAHIFVNTGMNRDGILPLEVGEFANEAAALKNVEINGIMTHFASADSPDHSFTISQNQLFKDVIQSLYISGIDYRFVHAANSGAIFQHPATRYNMIRPGLSIYGLMPDRRLGIMSGLQPVMSIKSRVLQINRLKRGDTTGYAFKYVADSDTRVAVIPLGYGDGYARDFSNKADCIIKEKRHRVVGSVCMDQLMVLIGEDEVKQGDEAILLGRSNGTEISAYDLADLMGTIPYEITTSLSRRIPRVFI